MHPVSPLASTCTDTHVFTHRQTNTHTQHTMINSLRVGVFIEWVYRSAPTYFFHVWFLRWAHCVPQAGLERIMCVAQAALQFCCYFGFVLLSWVSLVALAIYLRMT